MIPIAFKYRCWILSRDMPVAFCRTGWCCASPWCLSSTVMHRWCKLVLSGKNSVYKELNVRELMLNCEAGLEATFDESLWGTREFKESLNTSLCKDGRTVVFERMHGSILFQMTKWLVLFIYDKCVHLHVALIFYIPLKICFFSFLQRRYDCTSRRKWSYICYCLLGAGFFPSV